LGRYNFAWQLGVDDDKLFLMQKKLHKPTPKRESSRSSLEKEVATYRRRLPKLLEHEGQFVLIKGNKVLGIWPDRESALIAGYKRVSLRGGFLVQEIRAVEKVVFMPFDISLFKNVSPIPAANRRRRRR
jgi:hypothetical protein